MNRKEFPVWKMFLKKNRTALFLQMEGRQRQGKRKQKLMLRNKKREVREGRTRTEEVPRKRISIQNLSQCSIVPSDGHFED